MRESVAFTRRCWRQQPMLSAIQAGFAVLLGLIALAKLTADDPSDLSWLTVLLVLGEFVCFVLLIRRDEPDLGT